MTPKETLVAIARQFLGVKEVGGNNMGPMVERFQRAVDGKAAGEPWCMAFVQFCIMEVEEKLGIKSSLTRSEHCMNVWSQSAVTLRSTQAGEGRIAIWRRPNSLQGHTGIVSGWETVGVFKTIEGNTGPARGVNRDGDGVFEKSHLYHEEKVPFILMGFLEPFGTSS